MPTYKYEITNALKRQERTQAWLARRLGVTPSALNHWLAGRYPWPAGRITEAREIMRGEKS